MTPGRLLLPRTARSRLHCRAFFQGVSVADMNSTIDIPVEIMKWHTTDGGLFNKGDPIIDVGTHEAPTLIRAKDSGIIAKILKPEGCTVLPASPVVLVVKDDTDFREFQKLKPHDYHEFTLENV